MKPKRKRKNSKSIGVDTSSDYSSEDDEKVPYDVEIPTISTADTEGTQDSYSMELQTEEDRHDKRPDPNSRSKISSPPEPLVRALSSDLAASPIPIPVALALTRSSSWDEDDTTSKKADSTTPPSPDSSSSSSPWSPPPPQQDATVPIFRTPTASRDDSCDGRGAIIPDSSMDGGNCCISETGVLRSASSLEEDAYGAPAPLYAAKLIGATREEAHSRSLALPSSMNLIRSGRTTITSATESADAAAAADVDADAEESKQEEETASSASTRSETPALSAPFTLLHTDSLSHFSVASNSEHTYDDETEGNVCAICLNGYSKFLNVFMMCTNSSFGMGRWLL
jgi:hypothetical protein